jgi:VWFA-related protein
MRRVVAWFPLCLLALVASPVAQQPAAPSDSPQTTFRAGVDVIQLDVSVLDKNRRPVRGLNAADFTVFENGKPQRIIAVTEVGAVEADPVPTAWMRLTAADVATNDLSDQLGPGRLFAIFINDGDLGNGRRPAFADAFDMNRGLVPDVRAVARAVVDRLGPSDLAAVVFPIHAGQTQDFTNDHDSLADAIDAIETFDTDSTNPNRKPVPVTPPPAWIGGSRFGGMITGPECWRSPLIPTLDALVTRLANVPRRRKTLIYIGRDAPSTAPGNSAAPAGKLPNIDPCADVRAAAVRELLRKAQRGNVDISAIDPSGTWANATFPPPALRGPAGIARGPLGSPIAPARPLPAAGADRLHRLKVLAEETGGRAVVGDDRIEPAIDAIFEEDAFYYLVGYQTSNAKADGAFRRVEVKVNRSGATARTSSGYWAPEKGKAAAAHVEPALEVDIGATSAARSGLSSAAGVALRASVLPMARHAPDDNSIDVAVVLTVRLPPLVRPASETLTMVRNVYDTDGRPGPPTRSTMSFALEPTSGDDTRYDALSRFALAPGRYQIRLEAHSALIDRSGSVYADIDVPDVDRLPLSMSGIELGVAPGPTPRTDALAAVMPIVPTTEREFASGRPIAMFVRLFQGAASPLTPVHITAVVFNTRNEPVFTTEATQAAASFDESRSSGYQLELPLAGFPRGPYLLSITSSRPDSASVRRDVRFRVR